MGTGIDALKTQLEKARISEIKEIPCLPGTIGTFATEACEPVNFIQGLHDLALESKDAQPRIELRDVGEFDRKRPRLSRVRR